MYVVKKPVIGEILEFTVKSLDDAIAKMKTINDSRSYVECIEDSDVALVKKYDAVRGEFRISLHCVDLNNELTDYFNEKIAEDHVIDTVVYDRDGELNYVQYKEHIVAATDERATFKINGITDIDNLVAAIKEDLAGNKYNPMDVLFGYTDEKGKFNCMYNIYKDFRKDDECFFMIFGKINDEVKLVLNSFNKW